MIGKMPTIAAMAYKYSIGQPFIGPRNELKYSANFLHMCFAMPSERYEIAPALASAMRQFFILHADHEPAHRPLQYASQGHRGPTPMPASQRALPVCGGLYTAVLPRRQCCLC